MRPKILLLDEPCKKAREIIENICDIISPKDKDGITTDFTIAYTQLTPIITNATVFTPCTGTDHVNSPNIIHLDNTWKATEGLKVTSTAEHTWSLILKLAKLKRMQLYGKNLGVIGNGRIGIMVANYGKSFGMNVWKHDIDKNKSDIGLQSLLKKCDVISIHVPLENNKCLIGYNEFNIIKKGSLLVNTSRQSIVDILLLEIALNKKSIYYADDFGNLKINHKNVIQTNHIGGNCLEAREMTDIYIANKIKEYVESKEVNNAICNGK